MRHVTRPDGTVEIVLEVVLCEGCHEPFRPGPLYTRSTRRCFCDGVRGDGWHYVHCCLRPGCRTHTLEPACTGQWGPSADYR